MWNSYGAFWFTSDIMLQCLEGFKSLLASVLRCCDIDINQPRGLEDPELLARETVCMPLKLLYSTHSLLAISAAPTSLKKVCLCQCRVWITFSFLFFQIIIGVNVSMSVSCFRCLCFIVCYFYFTKKKMWLSFSLYYWVYYLSHCCFWKWICNICTEGIKLLWICMQSVLVK